MHTYSSKRQKKPRFCGEGERSLFLISLHHYCAIVDVAFLRIIKQYCEFYFFVWHQAKYALGFLTMTRMFNHGANEVFFLINECILV